MKIGTKVLLASIAIAFVLVAAWRVNPPHDKSLPTPEYTGTNVPRPATVIVDGTSTSPAAAERTAVAGAQPAPVVDSAPSETRATDEVAHVRVLVLDRRGGTPIADAYVIAQCSDDLKIESVSMPQITDASIERHIADAEGRVEIEVPAGRDMQIRAGLNLDWIGSKITTVHALARGASVDVTLRIPNDRDLNFWCRFIDEATRAPIAGVSVSPTGSEESTPPVATSDEHGLVYLVAEDWRRNTFRASYAGRSQTVFCPESGRDSVDNALIVPLTLSASLRVRVVDTEQKPIVGAVIAVVQHGPTVVWNGIRPPLWESMYFPAWSEVTDDEGRVTFRELPARIALEVTMNDEFSMEPVSEGAVSPHSLFLAPGEERAFQWTALGARDVDGRVVDAAGVPVAGCSVWLVKRPHPDVAQFLPFMAPQFSTRSGPDGRFKFKHIHVGEWSIGPGAQFWRESPPAESCVSNSQHLDLAESSAPAFVEIRVQRGLVLRGRVLTSNGTPADGALVTVKSLDHVLLDFVSTEDDGSFAVGGLSADTFVLAASGKAGSECRSEELRVEAGAGNVVLHLRKGMSMSGQVVDANGHGAATFLTISRTDTNELNANPFDFEQLTTDTDGDFSVVQLEPGSYNVAAYHADGRVGLLRHVQLAAERDTNDLVVRLERGGRGRIRAAHATGVATFKLFANDVLIDAWEPENGEYRTSSVPAGRTSVHVELDNGRVKFERGIDVAVGETVELSIGDEAR